MIELPVAWASPAFPSRIRTESTGGASTLALADGEISGRLLPMSVDLRFARAVYELRVDNGTSAPVAAFAYPLGHFGAIDWHAGTVPPFSSIAVRLDLPYDRGRPQGAVAHVFSHEASLTLEAPFPLPQRRNGAIRAAAIASALVTLALYGVVTTAMKPAIVAFVAPERVTMGRPFTLTYASAESDALHYDVTTPDGLVVRHGDLPAGSGTFALDLPLTSRGLGYDVALSASGSFGDDRRIVHVAADPPVIAAEDKGARIDAFALASDSVTAGDSIVVNYRTDARSGVVQLIDQFGTERAEALLSHLGVSTLIAPYVDRDQDLRVVLTTNAPHASDTAAAPIHIVSGPEVAPPPATIPGAGASVDAAPVADVPEAGGAAQPVVRGPIGLGAGRIAAGQDFVVYLLRRAPGTRISIAGSDGTELSAVRPPAGAERVVMRAPSLPATYTLIATFERGVAQDSVVLPLTVTAKESRP